MIEIEEIKQRCFSWMKDYPLEFDESICVIEIEESNPKAVVASVIYEWQGNLPSRWVEATLTKYEYEDQFKVFAVNQKGEAKWMNQVDWEDPRPWDANFSYLSEE